MLQRFRGNHGHDSKPTLEKDSSLDEENNRVYYYVTINPGAKDLHPGERPAAAGGHLDLAQWRSATLRPETIKLYKYNAENADGHYLGEDISDNTVFRVDQTEGEENSYTFTVPDGDSLCCGVRLRN